MLSQKEVEKANFLLKCVKAIWSTVLCKVGVSSQTLIANKPHTSWRPQSLKCIEADTYLIPVSSVPSHTPSQLWCGKILCSSSVLSSGTGVFIYLFFLLLFFSFLTLSLFLCNEFQTPSSLQTFQQSLTHHIGGLEHLQPDQTRSPTREFSLLPLKMCYTLLDSWCLIQSTALETRTSRAFWKVSWDEMSATFSAVPLYSVMLGVAEIFLFHLHVI